MKRFPQTLRRGFTLIEVMLAMMILIMLTGALFSIVRTTMQAASMVHQEQTREEQISGLIDLLSQTFRTLPRSTVIVGETRNEEGQNVRVLVLQNAPNVFSWGKIAMTSGESVLMPRALPGGLMELALSTQTESDNSFGDQVSWLPLIGNIKEVSWRFYDTRSASWAEEWADAQFRPALIELTFSPAEMEKPIKHIFWVPPVQMNIPGE